jgi:hypothetical protein
LFISFEGGEGAGKSTLIQKIYEEFLKREKSVLLTRAPGGTMTGELIRHLLLHHDEKDISSRCELFLFLADRAQHVQQVILPALKRAKTSYATDLTASPLPIKAVLEASIPTGSASSAFMPPITSNPTSPSISISIH